MFGTRRPSPSLLWQRGPGADVPDPYYGGPDAFERMLDLVEPATEALLARVIEASPVE